MFLTYYINTNQRPITNQQSISFDQLFDAQGNLNTLPITPVTNADLPTLQYRTLQTENLSDHALQYVQRQISTFDQKFRIPLSMYKDQDMHQHYETFKIPKASGGLRTINAPSPDLKELLKQIKDFCYRAGILAHSAAYAYVPGRTAQAAVTRHIKTKADWYLHLDLHNFFGSCNTMFILSCLNEIPFFRYMPMDLLELLMHCATLDDGLPQGTPLSPWLTNQLMVQYDYQIQKACHQIGITYTRYADDMLFSTKKRDKVLQAKPIVENILKDTPLQINAQKTRVSSIYGKNWQLGLMLNQHYNATVGTKKKETCRAALQHLCLHPEEYDTATAREFQGKLAYYIQIEPTYFNNLIQKYNQKYNKNIQRLLTTIIKRGHC